MSVKKLKPPFIAKSVDPSVTEVGRDLIMSFSLLSSCLVAKKAVVRLGSGMVLSILPLAASNSLCKPVKNLNTLLVYMMCLNSWSSTWHNRE